MGVEVAAAATAAQMYVDVQGASAQEIALGTEAKQSMIASQQKSLANYSVIQNTVAAQTAAATTRGYSLSSPSFATIEQNTYNKGSQASQNIQTESDITQDNIAQEKRNVQVSLFGKLFGDVSSLTGDMAQYDRSKPVLPNKNQKSNLSGSSTTSAGYNRLPGT